MKTTIRDQRIVECDDTWELEMSIYSIELCQREEFEKLEAILGTSFHKDQFKAPKATATGVEADTIRYPLSLIIRPEMWKHMTEQMTAPKKPLNPETAGADNLFFESKETFKNWMGQAGQKVQATGRKGPGAQGGFKEAPERKLGGR